MSGGTVRFVRKLGKTKDYMRSELGTRILSIHMQENLFGINFLLDIFAEAFDYFAHDLGLGALDADEEALARFAAGLAQTPSDLTGVFGIAVDTCTLDV